MNVFTINAFGKRAVLLSIIAAIAFFGMSVADAAQVTVAVDDAISGGLDTSALVTAIGKYGAGIIAALAGIKVVKYIAAVIV